MKVVQILANEQELRIIRSLLGKFAADPNSFSYDVKAAEEMLKRIPTHISSNF